MSFSEMSEKLRTEMLTLVDTFKTRAKKIRSSKELLKTIKPLDKELAIKTAYEYFTPGEYLALGIDGSMQTDELLEMFIFYANATAYKCSFNVSENSIEFNLSNVERDEKLSIASVVPLWMEDLPEATDTSFIDTEYQLNSVSTKLPFAVMTMAELRAAYRATSSKEVRIIFLDRPLSGSLPPLARDYREILRTENFSLLGTETPEGPLCFLDILLAYHLGSGENYLPPRERYLPYFIIRKLLDGKEHSVSEIKEEIHIDEKLIKKALKQVRKLNLKQDSKLLEKGDNENENKLQITEYAGKYWKRVKFVLNLVIKKVFEEKDHPLHLGEDRWLTSKDLNAINVLLLYELKRISLKNKILVIGIAKDTASTELGRAVIPFSISKGLLSSVHAPWTMKSDRALLGILSTSEDINIPTPWRTIGYDAIFTTLIFKERNTPNLIAARRRAGIEGLFVRSYFQLRSLISDPKSKSPVFLYDRFQDDDFDKEFRQVVQIAEMNKICEANLYFEGSNRNKLDELVLLILSKSDNPYVAEAFGHNQLLFLADKAVKAEAKQARPMLRGIVGLEVGPLARVDRMFNIARRFRDIRAEYEKTREVGGERS